MDLFWWARVGIILLLLHDVKEYSSKPYAKILFGCIWIIFRPLKFILPLGELEEGVAELEESRRRLVNLKMQKRAASETYTPTSGEVNGNLSPEKMSDKSMGLQELKGSIEEAQVKISIFQNDCPLTPFWGARPIGSKSFR